jgi:hypothetical protein
MKKIDIVGQKFGMLTVVSEISVESGKRRRVSCVCDCGNKTNVIAITLMFGKTISCGCYKNKVLIERSTTHGKTGTREYRAWYSIKRRCNTSSYCNYKNYGGRGITVCDRWKDSFENFYADMGDAPEGTSIDRIDNNGNYEPSNCRWATDKEQRRNMRTNHMITFSNKTQCVADWASELGISQSAIYSRLNKLNWSIEKSLTTPLLKRAL